MQKLAAILVSLVTSEIAAGQETEARVRALILSPGEKEMKLSLIAAESGKVSDPVLVGNMGLSETVIVAERKFSFVIPAKAAESGFRNIGEAALPAVGSDFIVLLEPAGDKFNTHVVAGKLPGFGRGDTLFFNATKMTLGATLGSRRILVPPRKAVPGGPSAEGRESWYQVTFYQPEDGGGSRKFGDTRWPYRNHARAYVFFYPNGPFNGVSYHVVDEMMGDTKTE